MLYMGVLYWISLICPGFVVSGCEFPGFAGYSCFYRFHVFSGVGLGGSGFLA